MNNSEMKKCKKNMWYILMLVCVLLSGFMSWIIKYYFDFPPTNIYDIGDFEISGATVENGNLIVAKDTPQLVLFLDRSVYINDIGLYFDYGENIIKSMQIFTVDGDVFIPEKDIINVGSEDINSQTSVSIRKSISALRIDLNADSNGIIKLKYVVLNPKSFLRNNYIFVFVLGWFVVFALVYQCYYISHNYNGLHLVHFNDEKKFIREFCIRIVELFFTLALLTYVISKVTYFFNNTESYAARNGYYGVSNCEVLLLGTSHMHDGVYPMELWKKYGISAYNLAYPGERLPITYYSFMDSIEARKPKLIVIDVYGLTYGNEKNDSVFPKRAHYTFDAMKFSKNKLKGIMDCLDRDLWGEFIFPFSAYHERWNDLSVDIMDIKNNERVWTRGACLDIGVAKAKAPQIIDSSAIKGIDNNAIRYLASIVELCNKEDIQVLMICIPYPATEEEQLLIASAKDICNKYDHVDFLNMIPISDVIGIDYTIDMADETSHLNPSGARKVTDFLGKFIVDNYYYNDYRQDKQWIIEYEAYLTLCKNERVVNTTNFEQYMMLLSDPDYVCEVYLNGDIEEILLKDGIKRKLLDNVEEYSNIEISDLYGYANGEDVGDVKIIIEVRNSETREEVDCSKWNSFFERVE